MPRKFESKTTARAFKRLNNINAPYRYCVWDMQSLVATSVSINGKPLQHPNYPNFPASSECFAMPVSEGKKAFMDEIKLRSITIPKGMPDGDE